MKTKTLIYYGCSLIGTFIGGVVSMLYGNMYPVNLTPVIIGIFLIHIALTYPFEYILV